MSLVQAVSAPTQIAAALQNASAQTGADFNYLLNTAMRESSLNCSAKSATSSACGLFQFTEQTWLATMKKDGGSLGLGQYADQISRDSHGKYVVADPAARREILALRDDPLVSALMAGAYTNASKDRLEASLGRSVSSGELYVAHFLGAGGATKLISAAEDTPNARADMLFPQAAAANRSIFYTSSGAPKTVGQVYQNLVTKHQGNGELAPRPVLASAALERAATPGAMTTTFDAANDDAAGASYSASATGYGSAAVSAAAASISRSPLKLTPGVLAVLNSLDAPTQSERKDAKEERDNKTKVANRLLPRSGFAYG